MENQNNNTVTKKGNLDGNGIVAAILIGFSFVAFSFLLSGIYFQKKVESIFEERIDKLEDKIGNNSTLKTGSDDDVTDQENVINDPTTEETDVVTKAAQKELTALKDTDYIIGKKDAKLLFIEYSDPDCPYCAAFHQTMEQLTAEYPNDVAWVYRNFPLDSLHRNARAKSEIMECAGEQGKFWEIAKKNYDSAANGISLSPDELKRLAKELGLDENKFNTCVTDRKYKDKVEQDVQDAQAMGGSGTPFSLFVRDRENGEILEIPGALPIDTMRKVVEQYLNEA